MNLVFLGAPGAGKGTQTKRLIKNFHFTHLSTGDLLRKLIVEKHPLGIKAKSFMDEGSLVPDSLIIDMIKTQMTKKKGYVFDGFPRTLAQAEALDQITNIDKVVFLDIPQKEVIRRLTGRRICRKCGFEYHVEFLPSKKGKVCEKCGGNLYQRDDDKEGVIKKRLSVFTSLTTPLIQYYENKLLRMQAIGTVEEIYKKITEGLNLSS
ncbi:MAG: adenylate kinase [Deltaproteobacteria bacterium]|nr:adenylate kinase [Deltaproteobacteria bacterium]